MGDLRAVRVHRDQALVDEPAEQADGAGTPAVQFGQPDDAPGRRGVVGHVHQPQEQPPGHFLLFGGKPGEDALGRPGDGVGDPAAGPVVRDRDGAGAAELPGAEQGVREQRERAGLVRARRVRRGPGGLRAQVPQQQLDQPVLHLQVRPPGRLHDRLPDLVGGHRPEHDLPGLQRVGQFRVAQGLVVEVGPERQDHGGLAGQVADRGDELPPLVLVLAPGEDRLELVHDQVADLGRKLLAEVGGRGGGRHDQRGRAGQPRHQPGRPEK